MEENRTGRRADEVAADGNVVQILLGLCVQMEEHSASLPLVRLSLQREL